MEQNSTNDISRYASFKKANENMIAKNDKSYSDPYGNYYFLEGALQSTSYTLDEIMNIVYGKSIEQKIRLSLAFFAAEGYYRQIVMYYATLLKYMGILIPSPSQGKSLSQNHIQKRYYSALDFLEKMKLPSLLTHISIKVMSQGCYYGVILDLNKDKFSVLDLPVSYCRSRFKDTDGNDVIEFDVRYFDSIFNKNTRDVALRVYPKCIQKAYITYHNNLKLKNKSVSPWTIIPGDIGVCFPFLEGAVPPLLSTIPAVMEFNRAKDLEHDKDLEEIKKIIVQKVPHLSDGRLLFEPDEAEVMHDGAVGMLKGNKNVSVLTTYTDVDSISSKTQSDNVNNTLGNMKSNIYSQSGVSSEIFSSTGGSTLETSIKNDTATMMALANKYSSFITYLINKLFSHRDVSFKYMILPITYYNDVTYTNTTLQLANSGYSFLLPALGMGLNQKDLTNVKALENDELKLKELLIPLSSSYTSNTSVSIVGESAGKNNVGRPRKSEDEKAEKTIINEESSNRTEVGDS